MQTVMTNSGVELRVESNIIYTTDSKAFWRSGTDARFYETVYRGSACGG